MKMSRSVLYSVLSELIVTELQFELIFHQQDKSKGAQLY